MMVMMLIMIRVMRLLMMIMVRLRRRTAVEEEERAAKLSVKTVPRPRLFVTQWRLRSATPSESESLANIDGGL